VSWSFSINGLQYLYPFFTFLLLFVAGRGVYFVFRDQGACATLLSVHVYYVTCPSVVTSLASFPETAAGPEITSIVQRDGVCVAHSAASEAGRPSYLCKADGSWYFLSGECHCLPGYEPHNGTTRCIGNASHQPRSYKKIKWTMVQFGADRWGAHLPFIAFEPVGG